MNNNGTGLVLASIALAQYPTVMIPVIFYNLIQHLVAGVVECVWCRKSGERHGRNHCSQGMTDGPEKKPANSNGIWSTDQWR